jgi:glutamyl-tRNA synthetase
MTWLGLDWDQGPFFQMQRLQRYQDIAERLLQSGDAYWCYASKEELDAMREGQRARGEKPRYDGRWRNGGTPPPGVKPVLRFKNPADGDVVWHDLVKGEIRISNHELDDVVLLRSDGVPTYNFGVVVDDIDMEMTHVIRGDDHVNNTPRQINLYRAIGVEPPHFAHVPMILGPDGERLSKRHGAVSVTQYRDEGFLPEALLNYLARLGWSHGDEEVFSQAQLIEWFGLDHISRSPARFDTEKLLWLNQHYLKDISSERLTQLVRPLLVERGFEPDLGPDLSRVVDLLKSRVHLLPELGDAAVYFYTQITPRSEDVAQHLTDAACQILKSVLDAFKDLGDWTPEALSELLKSTAKTHGVKMGQVGIPLRIAVCGEAQTPSIDQVLALIGRDEVIRRLSKTLGNVA